MDYKTILSIKYPANFIGEILKIEFENGSPPIYLEWADGNFGGWVEAYDKNHAVEQWKKQTNGIELHGRGIIKYKAIELKSPENLPKHTL